MAVYHAALLTFTAIDTASQNDPLSRCNCTPPYTAFAAIAGRGDLNDPNGAVCRHAVAVTRRLVVHTCFASCALSAGVYPPFYGFGATAGVDGKITSKAMLWDDLSSVAISSPTYDQQPVFQFSTSPFANTSWLGMPDTWKFPWMKVQWRDA